MDNVTTFLESSELHDSFMTLTGFDMSSIVLLFKSLFKMYLGLIVGVLQWSSGWIVAIVAISCIIMFSSLAFRYFYHH